MGFEVSRLESVYSSRTRTYPLETIALEMRKGTGTLSNLHAAAKARTLAGVTAYARELLQTRGHAAYDEIKKTMPQFLPAVVARSRSTEDIEAFSGLVCLEYDDDEIDTDYAFVLACQNPHVAMVWRSLSGKPKILVRVAPESVDGEALSLSTFPHAWLTAVQMFEELGEADPSAARPFQLQNICYDPDRHLRLDAIPLAWSVDTETLHESVPRLLDDLTFDRFSELGQEYIEAFERMEYKEQGIGKERVPCPWGSHANDGWGLRSNATRVIKHAEHDFTLKCFKCGERKRYNLTASKPSRYHVDCDFIHETSSLEVEREANQNTFTQWLLDTKDSKSPELLILGGAAGTGKTTVAITTADHLLYISKTTEEADQVFQTLLDAGEDAIRHRPRLFNRDHPDWNTLPLGLTENDRPCIKPELCNLYAERGHATHDVCHRCPLLSECQETGYLSQDAKERNTKKVVYAWDEAFACDRIHTERVKRICTKEDILIVDEVNPANLTQHRQVTREMLYDLKERFRVHQDTVPALNILTSLLDLISTAEDDKAFMDGLTAHIEAIEDVEALDDMLEKYPVGYVFSKAEENKFPYRFVATLHYRGKEVTVPVVSHETALDTPVFEIEAETPITVDKWQLSFLPVSVLLKVGLVEFSDPPRRFRRFLTNIKGFLDENRNLQTAPGTFDAKAQVFDFHLKPTLNHRRAVFNTASDPDNLISEAYSDTEIRITRHTGTPPAWKRALVFQIATGNYLPRHSLIGSDAHKKLHLKPRAEELINAYIKPSIEAGLKVLVVAPKAFQKVEGVKKWAATKRKDFQGGRNALLINHHHAEGRNDYQDFDIVFVFHYEPDHYSVQQNAKRLYRNPETPLDFTREKRTVTVGGVRFEKVVYVDARVQAVYNRECRERLMQSVMRLRPNIHEGKIIVFLTAEPVAIPVTPVAFSLADGECFDGDWQAFGEKLQEKSGATVQELVDAGVNERTAYRQTENGRRQSKVDRDAELLRRVLELKEQNIGERKIAKRLGISYGKVRFIVRKYKGR